MLGTPVLQRDRELEALRGLGRDAAEGAGGTVIVEGQPGMGKSTLLVTVAHELMATGAMTVLRFGCGELEQHLAWSAVRGLLGESPALERALAAARDGQEVYAAVHAVSALVRDLADDGPLVLVLDDAHWCDGPSLRLLTYLQRRIHALGIGLMISTRPPATACRQALLEQLLAGPDTEVVRLASLGREAVEELVRTLGFPGAEDTFCAACAEVTAGNPFYLRELLRELAGREVATGLCSTDLAEITPPAVLRSLVLRLDQLAAPAVALAKAAAVLDDGAPLRYAAILAEVGCSDAAEALDALSAAHLLAPGEPLRFLHPLVRTAIYAEIPAARRARQHAMAAELLADEGAVAEKVALHLRHAPREGNPAVVAMLRAAAARARAQGAPRGAVRHLRRALEEPPPRDERAAVLTELAQAETAIGDPEAAGRLTEALALCTDPARQAEILRDLGWSEHHAGRFVAAADAFERGLVLAGERADPSLVAELEAGFLVAATLDSRRVADANRRIEVIERGSGGQIRTPAHRMLLAQTLFSRTMQGSPHGQIVELAQRIWADGELLREEGPSSHTLWHVVGALSWADAYGLAVAATEDAMAVAGERGLVLATAHAHYARSWPNLWMCRIGQAAADAWEAISIWNGGLETYLPAAVYWFGLASLERDDVSAARSALALAGPPERWEQTGMLGFIHGLRGHIELRTGQVAEAARSFARCGEVMDALLIVNPAVMPWRSDAAHALRVLGERDRSRALAEQELEYARRSGVPRAIGVALRACGLCAEGAEGIRLLQEAVAVLQASEARLEHARALVDLGAAIRRAGRRREARVHLSAGLEISQAGGATFLARQTETELRAAGGRARRSTDTGPDALTASERRVAELAAAGHTNRTIAGQLQISVKAVEWHLHQSYGKLGVSGRRQLPAALRITL